MVSISKILPEIKIGPEEDEKFIRPDEDDTLLSWFETNDFYFSYIDKGKTGYSSKIDGYHDEEKLDGMFDYLRRNNPEIKIKTTPDGAIRLVTKHHLRKTLMFPPTPPPPPANPNIYHFAPVSEMIKLKNLLL